MLYMFSTINIQGILSLHYGQTESFPKNSGLSFFFETLQYELYIFSDIFSGAVYISSYENSADPRSGITYITH